MTSTRFPGKITAWMHGETILGRVISQLHKCKTIGEIYVAIPLGHSQRELFDYEKHYDVTIFDACQEDDVTGRFGAVCDFYKIRDFVRVCSDSPLLQPWVVDYAVDYYLNQVPNYVVTVGMPDGMNAEVVDYDALKDAYPRMTKEEKEHVTLYFENHPGEFDCRFLDLKHLSIDTIDDLTRVREVAKYAI
jgi:spore coat polysaccharide biosynthesis protein SpsF